MKSTILATLLPALLTVSAHAAVFAHYSFDRDLADVSGNGRNGTLNDVGTAGNSGIIGTVPVARA